MGLLQQSTAYTTGQSRMTRWITTMGAALLEKVGRLGRTGMFLCQSLLHCVTPPVKGDRVLRQTWFIGWKSMLVIALTGTFTGMVVALQGFPTLRSCLLYTSPSPRDYAASRMPSSA